MAGLADMAGLAYCGLVATATEDRATATAQDGLATVAWRDQGGHDSPTWNGRACVSYTSDPELGPSLDSTGPITGQGRCLLTRVAPNVGRMVARKASRQGKATRQGKQRASALVERSNRESRLLAISSSRGADSNPSS